jgi:hypothetical protein
MPHTVIVHVTNADPFVAEIEDIPEPADNFLHCTNARLRDGKALHYVDEDAMSLIFPWHRISLLEIMPSEGERDDIDAFFRE